MAMRFVKHDPNKVTFDPVRSYEVLDDKGTVIMDDAHYEEIAPSAEIAEEMVRRWNLVEELKL